MWPLPGYHYNKKSRNKRTTIRSISRYRSSLGVFEETRSEEDDRNVTDDVTTVNSDIPAPIRVLDVDSSEEGISRSVLAVVAVASCIRVLEVGSHGLSELARVLSTGLAGGRRKGEELVVGLRREPVR
jgi:hypothetical protein